MTSSAKTLRALEAKKRNRPMRNAARSSGLNRNRPRKEPRHYGRHDSSGETEAKNDPLSILVVPHAVIEWQRKKRLLIERFLPKVIKAEQEKGKWAIFNGKTRLNALFDDSASAYAEILRIVGEKKKCLENKCVFRVKQL
jgi:hypothetical protein